MSEQNYQCEEVLDHLALIVDGDEATLERFADHLAECDACRDLRHDAVLAAELAAHAGADYEAPIDMARRVLEAIEARGDQRPRATVPTPEAPPPLVETASVATPVTITQRQAPPQAEAKAPAPKQPAQKSKVIYLVMAAAAAVLVVVGGVGIWLSQQGEEQPSGGQVAQQTQQPQQVQPAAPTGTSATIAQIVRAASDGVSGVTVRAGATGQFAPASVEVEVGPGGAIRTDDRTRARLRLSEGTELVLNHNTELTLDGQTPRLLHVGSGGEVLADVAHLEAGPAAVFQTPTGRVEVLGTKLLVSTTDEVATVRVTRGAVRVYGQSGEPVEVKSGEEATLPANGAATVSPAVNLAGSVAWSELGGQGQDVEPATGGIGELRARQPGEREESERPLNMTRHKVQVRIVGNVARTEVEEVFRNDSDVTLEGIYRFPMPADARIARLALDVDGRMEEGAFVERDTASKIWAGVIRRATPQQQRQQEEFIWVPGPWRDPALLEWQQGGQFQLRIFPIKARSERRVILAYEQSVQPYANGRRYVYPLAHSADASTRVGVFDLDVRVAGADPTKGVRAHNYNVQNSQDGGATRLAMTQANFLPAGDLVIDYSLPNEGQEMRWWTYQGPAAAAPSVEARAGSSGRGSAPEVVDAQRALAGDTRPYVVFALRPELPLRTQNRPRDYVLVVDSSQSMVGESYARVTQLVTGIVAEMDRRDRFTVLACDATCRAKPGGPRAPSSEAATEVSQWLSELRPAGASDLVSTIVEAATLAGQSPQDRDVRVIYLGDGVASVGHRRASAVAAQVRESTQGRSNLSFSSVGIGGEADSVVLTAIARAGGGHYIPFVPGQRTSATALRVLETTYGVSLRDARLEFPAGVTDVAPAALPTLRAGEEVVVAARFTGEIQGEVVLRGTVGGEPYVDRYPITLTASTAAGNSFVPRLWAAATINELELQGTGADQHRIVALSRGYGVMSRQTSLLVLESEAMFRAFRVDRSQPQVSWSGEEDMDGNESTGTEEQAGATVTTASLGAGGLGRAGSGSGYGDEAPSGRRARAPARMSAPDYGGADRAESESPREPMAAPAAASQPAMDALGQAWNSNRANEERSASRSTSVARRPAGMWMRRIWERVGSVNATVAERPGDRQAAVEAEAALRAEPNSRDRHRNLFRALSRLGDLERAEEIAEQWISRDRLDPEALISLSDVLGRRGRRDEALRLLTGIVDLEPDNKGLQERLVEAFERAGEPIRACSHRVALAEGEGAEAEDIAAAVRCEQALGRVASATQLLDGLSSRDLRTRVEREVSRVPRDRGQNGDVMLEATWSGPQDLDLSLVNSTGQRISWMGGRNNVVGDSARLPGRERLGLRFTPAGTYDIEVSRADSTDTTPITGQISVRALSGRRSIPFTMIGSNVRVGSVQIRRESRLVSF